MNVIDWSKAPDWAIAHAFHATAMGVKEVWVGEDKYQQFDHGKSFPYGGTVGATSYHNPRRYQFAFETPRPAPWSGEGLPPVGAVCEYHKLGGVVSAGADWIRVKIIATITDDNRISPIAVFMPCDAAPYVGQGTADTFRPIRMPEQIAAEEREVEIGEMSRAIRERIKHYSGQDAADYSAALYDAGYRKKVTQ